MKNQLLILTAVSVVFAFPAAGLAKNKDPLAAKPNLSFPVVSTSVIEMMYHQIWVDANADGVVDDNEWELGYDSNDDGVVDTLDPAAGVLVPIEVTENIGVTYTGSYPGFPEKDTYYTEYVLAAETEGGCFVDLENNETGELVPDGTPDRTEPVLMTTWLASMAPWYPQPRETTTADPNFVWNTEYVSNAANSWQADWELTDQPVSIDFVDWGNPMENTYPLVGYRFPVEIALYTKFSAENTKTAFKMHCLEYESSADEWFGTSQKDSDSFTYESYYATVLTNNFIAEVWNPDGTIEKINVGPGIGPSGKMNFASAVGGWVPKMTGVHRIWLHVTDPLIDLTWATVNDDDHYVMWTNCGAAEPISPNKLAKSGIIGNSTFIDVLVKKPNSSGGRK